MFDYNALTIMECNVTKVKSSKFLIQKPGREISLFTGVNDIKRVSKYLLTCKVLMLDSVHIQYNAMKLVSCNTFYNGLN